MGRFSDVAAVTFPVLDDEDCSRTTDNPCKTAAEARFAFTSKI